MTHAVKVVTSTTDLAPDGIWGYSKSIYAGVVAGLAALATALADGQISGLEWVFIVSAIVTAAGGTYGLPNAVKPVAVVGTPLGKSVFVIPGTALTPPVTDPSPKPYEDDLGGPDPYVDGR